uniref:Uncharacterized protein n=1 Tax=Siphoviridae sp. ct3b712 TaxID=2826283 RepID=A0A8S5M4C2_9CAUD|nr:MAG TPA: hypothetical protein [Siphoviridae sp. ct3b712]
MPGPKSPGFLCPPWTDGCIAFEIQYQKPT